ncbi:PREDICTED: signal recognition particle receptor subunit beta [Polistes canadensis]|uniref:signal recognition particle receptor subunit beta n=1 Tax=Polistes canadensis TaxID=91411 RepID=UPI000718DF3C|nr:PREDICTED: signal recognition particle receptor subunit beta [Polistes canadensis]
MDEDTNRPNEKFELPIKIILTFIVALIITLVVIAKWRKKKFIGQTILLTGLSDAGKTLIHSRLVHSKFVETYTSVKENIGEMVINNKTLRIVALPGDERLRYEFFDKYKLAAKAIIFVVDSVTFQKNIRDVAEYLYNLLSDIDEVRRLPILILCNKQDQTMAKGYSVIKSLLEKEMNLLKLTKPNQLETMDASFKNTLLGKHSKDFQFHQLNSKVTFAESSAFVKDPETPPQMTALQEWLERVA